MRMKRKEYSAGAVKHSFWFMEFRNEIKLLSGIKIQRRRNQPYFYRYLRITG